MRGEPRDINAGARPTCWTCVRPFSHCVCGFVAPFEAHCNVTILQHPHERKKYYSTTKIVTRALSNSRLIRGLVFDQKWLREILPLESSYLLYPSKKAVDCEQVPLDRNSTIVVLDGTWIEARKLLHRNPYLKELKHLSFTRELRSNYHIRKQPKPHCLSTLESVAHLLQLNANASGQRTIANSYNSLFEGFDRMVEQQFRYFPRHGRIKLTTEHTKPTELK